MIDDDNNEEDDNKFVDDDYEQEVLVDLSHDPELRHVILSVHMGEYGGPAEYMEQIERLVEEFGDNPDQLFASASLLDDFH